MIKRIREATAVIIDLRSLLNDVQLSLSGTNLYHYVKYIIMSSHYSLHVKLSLLILLHFFSVFVFSYILEFLYYIYCLFLLYWYFFLLHYYIIFVFCCFILVFRFNVNNMKFNIYININYVFDTCLLFKNKNNQMLLKILYYVKNISKDCISNEKYILF